MGQMVSLLVSCDDPKRAGNDTVATAIANILLHIHGVELGPNNGSGGTRLLTGCIGAVFADITLHQPAITIKERQSCAGRSRGNGSVASGLFHPICKERNWG